MAEDYGAVLQDIRARLSKIAVGFAQLVSPMDAARSFIGAGLTVMRATEGNDFTAAYFHGIGDEIEKIANGEEGNAAETVEVKNALQVH